ncbi:MAG: 30S ribosomal protein S17 [Sumerlaeia bacterium]
MANEGTNQDSVVQSGSQERHVVRRTYIGLVVSDKGDKTIVVNITTKKQHPTYKKFIRRDSKLHCHDAENNAQIGDTVEVREVTRKLSKLKRYELVQVIERAK